ncbi:MAG: carboxymuconolactone decarboxylase family protein [Candidatus Vecturithrix sp.]|nr:carboxymuconolactone decarboxylase family protein [Candidatus Vecturithrix sp.]
MESFIQQKIAQSVRDRKAVHQTFVDHVKTYPSFLELEKHAFSEGALSKKAKELMALSISIVTKCEPCMEWHVQQAYLAGATDQEIFEAIDVAIEMGGGPAAAYARFAVLALQYHKQNNNTTTS